MSRARKLSARMALVGAIAAAGVSVLGTVGAQAATNAPSANPGECGFTYWYQGTATYVQGYNHCGTTSVRIHVDVHGSGSANDYNLCVAPGLTALSYSVNIDNAYYIGGAGCPVGQRT